MTNKRSRKELVNNRDPVRNCFPITPSDIPSSSYDSFPHETRAIYVGVGGDITVLFTGDTVSQTMVGVVGGCQYPWALDWVYETGTTAQDIMGMY